MKLPIDQIMDWKSELCRQLETFFSAPKHHREQGSIIEDARGTDGDWLARTLPRWLFAPGVEWAILWDSSSQEPLPCLCKLMDEVSGMRDTKIERWEA